MSVAVLLHYFYLASFGWMLLEGVYLYIMVVEVFASTVKVLYLYLFAWGMNLAVLLLYSLLSLVFNCSIFPTQEYLYAIDDKQEIIF